MCCDDLQLTFSEDYSFCVEYESSDSKTAFTASDHRTEAEGACLETFAMLITLAVSILPLKGPPLFYVQGRDRTLE